MDYKLSNYIYFVDKDEDTFIGMNLINHVIFGLDKARYDLIMDNKDHINNVQIINPTLFSALEKMGIIIPEDNNEIEEINLRNRMSVYSTQVFRMTIIPTLECNLKCWYCYEDHKLGRMSHDTIKSIYIFVKKIINENNLRYFHLDWFGGEPMLCFEDIIYPVSKKIKQLCAQENITFINGITTNGVLINREIIKKMISINLNKFQITLDGNKEQHNKIKKSPQNKNTFQTIIDNLNLLLLNYGDELLIGLRINCTTETIKNISEIIPIIPEDQRYRVEIFFQQVWQTQKTESIDFKPYKKIFEENGYKKPELEKKFYKCYADLFNQVVILPDRRVFKCTARDFVNYPEDGILTKQGYISWNFILNKRLSKTTIDNEHCQKCLMLPLCWGPCSQKLLEISPKDFNKICNYEGVRLTIEEKINDFYERQILKM